MKHLVKGNYKKLDFFIHYDKASVTCDSQWFCLKWYADKYTTKYCVLKVRTSELIEAILEQDERLCNACCVNGSANNIKG